ncbi:MAG: hypothetical protein OEV87_05445 [Phycisphaerae bacterium]|nr:hypothetical protein [Phycisphaerae bacterium]
MINRDVFGQWFDKEVQSRWQTLNLSWIELGDWYWRLRDFDTDTLTEAVRKHKACEDWRVPSLKKVYDYAKAIQSRNRPASANAVKEKRSTLPDEHTFIMCVAKGDNGRGCVGHFVPILIWPFHTTYTADTYRRIAEEQCVIHSRNGRNGVWEPFYNTTHLEMMRRANQLCGTKPLDINEVRKLYKRTQSIFG